MWQQGGYLKSQFQRAEIFLSGQDGFVDTLGLCSVPNAGRSLSTRFTPYDSGNAGCPVIGGPASANGSLVISLASLQPIKSSRGEELTSET